jgi:hypothetical protein
MFLPHKFRLKMWAYAIMLRVMSSILPSMLSFLFVIPAALAMNNAAPTFVPLNLNIKVVTAEGKPVPNASFRLNFLHRSFGIYGNASECTPLSLPSVGKYTDAQIPHDSISKIYLSNSSGIIHLKFSPNAIYTMKHGYSDSQFSLKGSEIINPYYDRVNLENLGVFNTESFNDEGRLSAYQADIWPKFDRDSIPGSLANKFSVEGCKINLTYSDLSKLTNGSTVVCRLDLTVPKLKSKFAKKDFWGALPDVR